MTVRGAIYIYNNPEKRQLQIIADNRGEGLSSLTHNMFPDRGQAEQPAFQNGRWVAADDHQIVSHYNPVPAGTPDAPAFAQLTFQIGDTYHSGRASSVGTTHQVPIEPGTFVRVGFRGLAWHVEEIPAPGQVVVVPYEEMTAGTVGSYGSGQWSPEAMDSAARARGLPAELAASLRQPAERTLHGQVRIRPVPDASRPDGLAGWEVWFDHLGQPGSGGFIGTLVLTNEQAEGTKNAGLGLESMACPAAGFQTMQFIQNGGDYGKAKHGVLAQPGCPIRLGIRGHSHATARLPSLSEGERTLPFAQFEVKSSESSSDWFDSDALMTKLGEKKALIDIYRDGERINESLPDTVYVGQEAVTRAEFKVPPRVQVAYVDSTQPGWRVQVTSQLPAEDAIGPLACRVRLGLGPSGLDRQRAAPIPSALFTDAERRFDWFIPAGASVGDAVAEPGQTLLVDTGALGWRGQLCLPAPGADLDTHASPSAPPDMEAWSLRETDFHRAKLSPEECARLRAEVPEALDWSPNQAARPVNPGGIAPPRPSPAV